MELFDVEGRGRDPCPAGHDLTIYGDGGQTRSFCYAGDAVPALIDLMECTDAEGLAVNIGSTEEVTVLDLARLVIDLVTSTSEVRLVPFDEAYEPGFEDLTRRVPDISRARKLIGFEPRTSLRQIVDLMIADAQGRAARPTAASPVIDSPPWRASRGPRHTGLQII